MPTIPHHIQFVFPGRMTDGGMPADTRQFVSAVERAHQGKVGLMSRGAPSGADEHLRGVDHVDMDAGEDEIARMTDALTPADVTVFITFSDLTNVRLAKRLKKNGLDIR